MRKAERVQARHDSAGRSPAALEVGGACALCCAQCPWLKPRRAPSGSLRSADPCATREPAPHRGTGPPSPHPFRPCAPVALGVAPPAFAGGRIFFALSSAPCGAVHRPRRKNWVSHRSHLCVCLMHGSCAPPPRLARFGRRQSVRLGATLLSVQTARVAGRALTHRPPPVIAHVRRRQAVAAHSLRWVVWGGAHSPHISHTAGARPGSL